jgi:hypothetical protein
MSQSCNCQLGEGDVKIPVHVETGLSVFDRLTELTALTRHTVRFLGPPLGRRARGALSAAGVSVLERHPSADLSPQPQEYLVSVQARDATDAIRRVETVLQGHGSYGHFGADRR